MKTKTLIYQAAITLILAGLWVLNITSEPVTYFLTALCVFAMSLPFKNKIYFLNKNSLKGKWSNDKATEIIYRILSKTKSEKAIIEQSTFYSKSPLAHYIIGFYDYTQNSNSFSKVAITYSKPKNEIGHSASVSLSFIQFNQIGNGWKISQQHIAAIQAGSFAEPPSNIGIFIIGHNIMGVIIETGFTNQGITEIIKLVYANFNEEFKEIFRFVSMYEDSGITGTAQNAYETVMKPIKEGTGLYDLQLITTGIRDNFKIEEIDIYKYNGIKYEKVKSYL